MVMPFSCNSQSSGFSSRKGIRRPFSLWSPKLLHPVSTQRLFIGPNINSIQGHEKWRIFSYTPSSILNYDLLYSSPILLHWHQPDIGQHPAETAPWKACKNSNATLNFSFVGCENCTSLPLLEMLSTLCWNRYWTWNSAVTPAAMLLSRRCLGIFCCYSELD